MGLTPNAECNESRDNINLPHREQAGFEPKKKDFKRVLRVIPSTHHWRVFHS